MRLGFLPKFYTKKNVSRPIFVPAMHNQTDVALCKLCVCRALSEYVRCTCDFRHDCTAQLCIAYGRQVKGKPNSKQRLSKWLVECIKFAYDHNIPTPDGVEDHQTHNMEVTYADMAGADPHTICEAVCSANT